MNINEAQKLVEDQVLSKLDNCSIMCDETIEYGFGWVFFYQTDSYIQSKDFRDMTVGHGPVIVDKTTGKLFETGSAHLTEQYVETFVACGDPFAEPTNRLEVSGWKEGANKVATTKYIKEVSGLGLKESKNIVDTALSNEPITFSVSSPAQAKEAVGVICGYNFFCRQLWSNQC